MTLRNAKRNGSELGRLIYAYRDEHGLTYRAFVERARSLGYKLSVATVWNAEHGHSPTITTRFKFRKILGTHFDV